MVLPLSCLVGTLSRRKASDTHDAFAKNNQSTGESLFEVKFAAFFTPVNEIRSESIFEK